MSEPSRKHGAFDLRWPTPTGTRNQRGSKVAIAPPPTAGDNQLRILMQAVAEKIAELEPRTPNDDSDFGQLHRVLSRVRAEVGALD